MASDTCSPRLVAIPEAARLLAISERKVWQLLSTGALKPVRIGRATRIRLTDLDAFIAKGGA